ncbi:hypothetical protein [Nocardia abscessus]|uniref:hypothetical protein n=1 Tax=Nocardia abscessus TaxID=120957 RepID=UPI0024573424|nr:hypothetical protein [Nocardia abscessus]
MPPSPAASQLTSPAYSTPLRPRPITHNAPTRRWGAAAPPLRGRAGGGGGAPPPPRPGAPGPAPPPPAAVTEFS